jgi:hypothetical protein
MQTEQIALNRSDLLPVIETQVFHPDFTGFNAYRTEEMPAISTVNDTRFFDAHASIDSSRQWAIYGSEACQRKFSPVNPVCVGPRWESPSQHRQQH